MSTKEYAILALNIDFGGIGFVDFGKIIDVCHRSTSEDDLTMTIDGLTITLCSCNNKIPTAWTWFKFLWHKDQPDKAGNNLPTTKFNFTNCIGWHENDNYKLAMELDLVGPSPKAIVDYLGYILGKAAKVGELPNISISQPSYDFRNKHKQNEPLEGAKIVKVNHTVKKGERTPNRYALISGLAFIETQPKG